MRKRKCKQMLLLLLAGLTTGVALAQPKEKYYVKHLRFPTGSTLEQKVEMAARLVPTPQQLAWQQLELTAFLHFGINTFTGREWGDGREDPALFNPTELDAGQWVRALQETGFKMVILTAKHHDGFCLWPTKTTGHSVASSPWRDGRGDVVRELREACDRYGMKFGVYLSPWDRNAECYGDSPRYNDFFVRQLTELLTNYGEVHEVWFDGANGEGPNGKKQTYDWDAFYQTIRRLQPKAVMAIMGDDVRWVGNEQGLGRETEWSATVLAPGIYTRSAESNQKLGVHSEAKDLGSRQVLATAEELFWYPSEVDVSIRPGWFYHAEEDARVKSVKELAEIYYRSVGYNSVLLLNIPPDRRGLLHEIDVARLREFAAYRARAFAQDQVRRGGKLRQVAAGGTATYALRPHTAINTVVLAEDIIRGQRAEAFVVEGLTAAGWQEIARGTTIGYKRILRFPTVQASRLRIRMEQCRKPVYLNRVAAYEVEPLQAEGTEQVWNQLPRKKWRKLAVTPLTIDLGEEVFLSGFTYAPAGGTAKPSMAFRYTLSVSTDAENWQRLSLPGEFSNIMYNPAPQTVSFGHPVSARYIRLEATTPTDTSAVVEMDEVGVTLNP